MTTTPSHMTEIQTKAAQVLRVEDAQALIMQQLKVLDTTQQIDLFSALNRILAEDIISPIHVPFHDNSAMDGFAFNGRGLLELTTPQILSLKIQGEALAGHPYQAKLETGACVRIMTGAVMPNDCDTVIPQESCQTIDNETIRFHSSAIRSGENRRLQGEDLRQGQVALAKGQRLGPAELGLLASLGIAQVKVQTRLRVAYFSTGDEIRSLGEPLETGCIYDSNRYTIFGMLSNLGCDVIDLGVVRDHPEALEQALRDACEKADVIITSGGVSVGAADYTKQVMAKLGKVEFWTVAMRPGRPMAFGQVESGSHRAYLFGLPGNPVAVMVSFYFFVQNALRHLTGERIPDTLPVLARSVSAIKKRAGRTEYQRGIARRGIDGQLEVSVTGSQGSGILRSMSEANCMIVLKHEQTDVQAGDLVEIRLFQGFCA